MSGDLAQGYQTASGRARLRVSTVVLLVYMSTFYCFLCFFVFNTSLWLEEQIENREERREGGKEAI